MTLYKAERDGQAVQESLSLVKRILLPLLRFTSSLSPTLSLLDSLRQYRMLDKLLLGLLDATQIFLITLHDAVLRPIKGCLAVYLYITIERNLLLKNFA